MWTAWIYWLKQIYLSINFEMPQGFKILSSFGDDTPCRLFLTNADQEYSFLQFVNNIKQMRENLSAYSTLSSVAGI